MQSATKSRKPAEIQSACINRVTVKATGEVFYLVASDSHPGEYHTVAWDESRACYTCSCVARKPCKHIHAVESVQQAKRELLAEQDAREKKMSDFAMMHVYGIQVNEAGKMYHFIPAEQLPIPERKPEPVATIPHDDMAAHVQDSIESGEGDWIDEQRAAWQSATPDDRRAIYSSAFDLSYGDVA